MPSRARARAAASRPRRLAAQPWRLLQAPPLLRCSTACLAVPAARSPSPLPVGGAAAQAMRLILAACAHHTLSSACQLCLFACLLPILGNPLIALPAGGSRVRSLVRTRVEPKTFFANERTFLQWLQIRCVCCLCAVLCCVAAGRPRTARTFSLPLPCCACFDCSVLIMMTATSLLSGSGLLGSAAGSGGSGGCTDKRCFTSKVGGG